MSFFRKRHQRPTPREPSPEDLERAKAAASQAREQLHRVERQQQEVKKVSDSLEKTDRVNNLGPRFWAALGRPRDV